MVAPLRARHLRELRSDPGKYLVIFLLLVASIGFVSGFLVADNSMIASYHESFEKYAVEDGHFTLARKAGKAQRKAIREMGVALYDLFYTERAIDNGSTLRIFAERSEVNRACLMEGAMPAAPGEIAIDRMYADNNKIEVGDQLYGDGGPWTVTGLVALSDYSCLFSDNNDTMFDAVKFGVALVTAEEFSAYPEDRLTWQYAWVYDTDPGDAVRDRDDVLLRQLNDEVLLEEFIPRTQNQAITFTGEDMGSDKAMMTALLYILVGIMAFVFAVTTNNTIAQEAGVIGTLRASGYTRFELVRHYMAMPMAITAVSALLGNLLGYTVFKDLCAGMYYGSYSLPTYVTRWNGEAFLKTTVIPAAIMAGVNWALLYRRLCLSPLKFLHHDLTRGRSHRAVPLPEALPFMGRFRLRVILQNAGSYFVLMIGLLFANLLLMFGMGLPMVLENFQEDIQTNLLCRYQYLLTMPVSLQREGNKPETMEELLLYRRGIRTENPDAEPFSAAELQISEQDEAMLYGVRADSRYLPLDVPEGTVCLSSAYADKYRLKPGNTITLKEKYEDTVYTFTVGGVIEYNGALAVFMEQGMFNRIFGYDETFFCGYFSDTPITDIKEEYLGSVIDLEALTKVSRQLTRSMGEMMYLVDGFAVGIFFVLLYLLTKTIIGKNARSISMTKILGYTDAEIGGLYLAVSTVVVMVLLAVSLPVSEMALQWIFRNLMMNRMSGWIPFSLDRRHLYIEMFALGLAAYAVVCALEYRRIRQVPMAAALKNVE